MIAIDVGTFESAWRMCISVEQGVCVKLLDANEVIVVRRQQDLPHVLTYVRHIVVLDVFIRFKVV